MLGRNQGIFAGRRATTRASSSVPGFRRRETSASSASSGAGQARRTNGSGHNSGLLPVVFAFFAARFSFSDLPGFFVLCFCGDLSGMSPLSSWSGSILDAGCSHLTARHVRRELGLLRHQAGEEGTQAELELVVAGEASEHRSQLDMVGESSGGNAPK